MPGILITSLSRILGAKIDAENSYVLGVTKITVFNFLHVKMRLLQKKIKLLKIRIELPIMKL